ncbi:MAG: MarR family transcriptional regulator [Lachnospiraceae bacterium]|nr:MarR family transcriptional regulator [Lachnospiraceae bacterium]
MIYDRDEALKLDNQLCFPLYAAARKVTSVYTPYLKPLGLTYTQYITLMVLWEKDGISVSDICSRLMLDSGTVTPLLKKLESTGHIVRTRSKEDERSVIISLTESGRALKEKAGEVPLAAGSCIALEPEEAMQLYALLYKILGKPQANAIDEKEV